MERSKPLRILLADDHAILRESLRELLARQPDMTVVGEAADGLAAVRMAKRLRPDILLLDITMPKLDGVEVAHRVKEACPSVRVLAFTAHASSTLLNDVRLAGAAGYLSKHSDAKQLLFALRRIARGGVYFEPRLMTEAVNAFLAAPRAARRSPRLALSERETQVLRYLVLGYSAKEVAAELKLGTKSVETYKRRLMTKLEITSHVELIRYARLQGLTEPV